MALSRICIRGMLTKSTNLSLLQRFNSQQPLNLSNPAVQAYLHRLMIEHEDLLTKQRRTSEEARRLYQIKPIVKVLEERVALFESIESLKQLNKKEEKDEEIRAMIKEEAQIYLNRMKTMDSEVLNALFGPRYTEGGVLLEVTAGAGGQEAMLFAAELTELYENYAQYKGWEVDIASYDRSDLGGVRKASMLISGVGVRELMRLEAGVHRVQRIPTTEKGGRIHTSTVSVAVLPQPTEVEIDIPDRDVVIETKRASGAGGQHVNTTDSAVRLIHTPTGTAVECQEGRSQIKNKEIAFQKLRTLLLEKQIQDQTSKIQSERKSQVGSGNRNEKIRTYNYPQDRITEHREGGSTMRNLKGFMEGGEELEELQDALFRHQRQQELLEEINKFTKESTAQGKSSSM